MSKEICKEPVVTNYYTSECWYLVRRQDYETYVTEDKLESEEKRKYKLIENK